MIMVQPDPDEKNRRGRVASLLPYVKPGVVCRMLLFGDLQGFYHVDFLILSRYH